MHKTCETESTQLNMSATITKVSHKTGDKNIAGHSRTMHNGG